MEIGHSDKPQYGLGEAKERSYVWLYPIILCLLAVIAFSVGTQQVAAAYGYHSALGGMIYNNWYVPWAIIYWSQQLPQAAKIIDDTTVTGQFVFAIPQFVLIGLWQLFMRNSNLYKYLHGFARSTK